MFPDQISGTSGTLGMWYLLFSRQLLSSYLSGWGSQLLLEVGGEVET